MLNKWRDTVIWFINENILGSLNNIYFITLFKARRLYIESSERNLISGDKEVDRSTAVFEVLMLQSILY